VIILQKTNTPYLRKLDVRKNRFDGDVGEVSLAFNTDNKRYFEISKKEKDDLVISRNVDKLKKERLRQFNTIEVPNL